MSYLTGAASAEPSVTMNPACVDSNEPATQTVVKPRVMGVILTIAACLIISTNLLVAAALLKLLLRKSSQSWCFVLNLALADALVGVAITGLATENFTYLTQKQHNHTSADSLRNATFLAQGKMRCLMRMAFVASPCTASIMSMLLISLDRYAAIKMPLRYSLFSGKGTAVGSLLALWIGSIAVGFLPGEICELENESLHCIVLYYTVLL